MLGFSNHDQFLQAGEVLRGAGLVPEVIDDALGDAAWITPRAIALPRYRWRLREPSELHALIGLFVLGEAVDSRRVARALAPMTLDAWIDAGVLRAPASDGTVRSGLRIVPIGPWLLAADSPEFDDPVAASEFVMSPGGTTLQLGWSAIRRPARRVLDLGSGCGYLGLVASEFSEQVVATDCNPRAVEISWFNARLNGVDAMEARAGDLWEPVRGERFDLVLSNPPFVIAPTPHLTFRDSGVRGDEFCRRIIREVPELLEEGGYCQMLANLAHRADRPWREELAEWFADTGCDALVFVTRREPIDEYAMNWITTTESQDAAVVPGLFAQWMEDYARLGITEVSYLLVNLRRRSGPSHWFHVDDEGAKIAGPCGDAIAERFALLDGLARLDSDDAIQARCWRLHPEARLVQEHVMTDDGPRVVHNQLDMRGTLRHFAGLDVNVLRLLVGCDGQQPLRSLLDGMAEALGMERQRVTQVALPVVRHLIERGFLLPMP
ncbi:MAG: methyltransferase [Pirellulaceae bacterium]|nr:methyltransferase [Pirellulaceae bacterium]